MRASLTKWVGDADALWQMDRFSTPQPTLTFSDVATRQEDYYIALVGELFDQMRSGDPNPSDCALLGNALSQFAAPDREPVLRRIGISKDQARLFAASSFYIGGFPASANLTLKNQQTLGETELFRACFDLMAHPASPTSDLARLLDDAIRSGQAQRIQRLAQGASEVARSKLAEGPENWIPARILQELLRRFSTANIRAVLPVGWDASWNPLVTSFLNRPTPLREFFPSQIQAIQAGLLESVETFSLQMPTGAGKTALCEALLFRHLTTNPDAKALLLVPYRSLASELRGTLVRRLNDLGLRAKCVYGGTVPSGAEIGDATTTRAIVATPEALSGLLSAAPDLLYEISLVVVDEGHLLDAPSRGVGLELLISRFKARLRGAPKFVFMSAIVPNIEEINSWLGGSARTVVRSDYKPALAEFSVLRAVGRGAQESVTLEMHPHEQPPIRYSFPSFLQRKDFRYRNPNTGRENQYPFTSTSTRAVATARKAMAIGVVAIFAAQKRGNQGALGLAEELLKQLRNALPLPVPTDFAVITETNAVGEYLRREFGADWIGTRALLAGAVLHHGDVPQEAREVLELVIRREQARLVICTSTLAEGVNLPIRTLVLYSVERRTARRAVPLLARDIKNLVGRAGRAGSTTKGLVICANEKQWHFIEPVARSEPAEIVHGALHQLMARMVNALAGHNVRLTNESLERVPAVFSLVDGIDSTLVDLAAIEIGEEELRRLALEVTEQTLAFRFAAEPARLLLREIVALRVGRVLALRARGRLAWIQETGAKCRVLDTVEQQLLPLVASWEAITNPVDPSLVRDFVEWAWVQPEMAAAIRRSFHLQEDESIDPKRSVLLAVVNAWLAGGTFAAQSVSTGVPIDDLLGLQSQVISFVLQVLIEQGVALLARLLGETGRALSAIVEAFPEHLRFGAPTSAGVVLAQNAVRHRGAFVALGNSILNAGSGPLSSQAVLTAARHALEADSETWRNNLGTLVFENTWTDLRLP